MFSDVLKSLRKKSGYSQTELGEMLNLSKSAISMYEIGDRMPDHDMMKRISELFNVSMDYLYEKETPAEPSLSDLKLAILDVIDQIPEEQQRNFLEMAKLYRDSHKKD